jgi:tetratricopeptide (TPR) repeat protein
LASRLLDLAVSYGDHFHRLGNLDDLESALKYKQDAVDATPPGHPNLAGCLHGLAVSYTDHFQRLGNLDDLESALKHFQDAVNATPAGHPNLARHLQGLAICYAQLAEISQDVADFHCMLYYFRASTTCKASPPHILLQCARQWALLSKRNGLSECLDAYSQALQVLPDLVWMGHVVPVRHKALLWHDIHTLMAEGAAACMQFDHLELAAKVLEQGLAVIYQQLLQLRDEFSVLTMHHPSLAQKLRNVSLQLQSCTSQTSSTIKVPGTTSAQQNNPHLLVMEREKIIKKIRKLPQFTHFLLPSAYQTLSLAAQHGPVVMINCMASHSDAIILLSPHRPIQHVAFPGVSLQTAREQLEILRNTVIDAQKFDKHSEDTAQKDNAQIILHSVVSWLWSMIVSPVFDALHMASNFL